MLKLFSELVYFTRLGACKCLVQLECDEYFGEDTRALSDRIKQKLKFCGYIKALVIIFLFSVRDFIPICEEKEICMCGNHKQLFKECKCHLVLK